MADWNAELYSRFEKERTLPSYDLVRAVEGEPKTVLDIGCGIGNSTAVLTKKFPGAKIVGVDNSGTVTGVSITKHSETSGLGANATKEAWRAQFIGKSGTLAVTKDGGEIEALTGATITSRAVTSGVNSAIAAVAELG